MSPRRGVRGIVGRAGFLARLLSSGAALSAVAFCVGAPSARASIKIAADVREAALRVDTSGDAEVSWTSASGDRGSLVVYRDGSLRYGATLAGPDVSRATGTVSIPWAVTVRRTADGSFYALQSWRRLAGGPVELRLSRWKGAPTKLTLRTVCCKWGHENVEGGASFHGTPIFGQRVTAQGAPLDPYGRNVYLDSFRAGHWLRMMGILTHTSTGTFTLWIRPEWSGSRYRGTISGPNWGWTLGPDAEAVATSSER